MQLRIIPKRWDLTWSALYGRFTDQDNDIAPTDFDRDIMSTVLRSQVYLNDSIHLLVESSIAREFSRNGNAFREHVDSVLSNTDGNPDIRGFENGDTDTRITWQGKGGLVLNPAGIGIFTRPSLLPCTVHSTPTKTMLLATPSLKRSTSTTIWKCRATLAPCRLR